MAEKEYIERGAALNAILGQPPEPHYPEWYYLDIKEIPAADVVEVVRCAQCKHWKINPNNLYGGYCRYCESAKMDHFCSYGERKDATP